MAAISLLTLGVGSSALYLAGTAAPAGAVIPSQTVIVGTTADDNPGVAAHCTESSETPCTLRDAVADADAFGGTTTIEVPENALNPYAMTDGTLDVSGTNTVDIEGVVSDTDATLATPQADFPNIKGDDDNTLFKVESGTTANFDNVELSDGFASSAPGGGINNSGTITATDVWFFHDVGDGESAGAIYNGSDGTTTLVDDELQTNQSGAGGSGGAIENQGTLTVEGSIFLQNQAMDNFGGAITNEATMTIEADSAGLGTTFVDNSAPNGGAIADGDCECDTNSDTISDTTFNDNSATEGGGAINEDGSSTTDISNSEFLDNTTGTSDTSDGGAIYMDASGLNVSLTQDQFTGNYSPIGGAVADFQGALTTHQSSFDDSSSANGVNPNSESLERTQEGGAIYFENFGSSGDLEQTSFIDNVALAGGGVYEQGCVPIYMANDTFAGNDATGVTSDAEGGGGFESENCSTRELARTSHEVSHAPEEATVQFDFDTLSGNLCGAEECGGQIEQDDNSQIEIGNTSIEGNTDGGEGANCVLSGGDFTLGYNIDGDGTCLSSPLPTDLENIGASLHILGDYGGPETVGNPDDPDADSDDTPESLLVQQPQSDSKAIGAVIAAQCDQTLDELGNTRPGGSSGTCTIGAVEVPSGSSTPPPPPPPPPPVFNPNGYRFAAADGGIFDFGINYDGSLADQKLNAPIVGIANSPGPNGYLLLGSDGGVFALGGADYFGSLANQQLGSPAAAIASTPDGGGYWIVTQKGAVTNFGDAPKLPGVTVLPTDRIVGIASTNDGQGLWLVDNAGDVYTLGDAQYLGGAGGKKLNSPIVGIAAAATGQGYVLVASDGGVFAFGVPYEGSVPAVLKAGQQLNAPVVGIGVTHSGNGYWVVGADGGVFCFGEAPFLGDSYTQLKPGQPLNAPIIGIQHLGEAPA
ncbi:MAG TPA: hypothetical protein VGF87_02425 [Acidimicrobiales bacterium]